MVLRKFVLLQNFVHLCLKDYRSEYKCKKSPEIFPDWNWIAPCIPAGFGFISAEWLSKSIWKMIRIYLDFRKNDYYIICCAYPNGSIRLKILKIFHLFEEPFPYIYGNS